MFQFHFVGVNKPKATLTLANGWVVIVEPTAPLQENGVMNSGCVDISTYAPGNGGPYKSFKALTLDGFIVQLAIVQRR